MIYLIKSKKYILALVIFFISITNINAGKLNEFTDKNGKDNKYFWTAIQIVSTSELILHNHEASFKTKKECNNFLLEFMEKDDLGLNYAYSKSRKNSAVIDTGGQIKAMSPPRGMGYRIICMTIPLPY